MKVSYPVVFTEEENNYLIEVPNLHIMTQGNDDSKKKCSVSDAISMARDAIGLFCINAEDKGDIIPDASLIYEIKKEDCEFWSEGKSFISYVDVDLLEYRRRIDNRSVRKNVTIPNWLNIEAEKADINVSRVLQEALKERLGFAK